MKISEVLSLELATLFFSSIVTLLMSSPISVLSPRTIEGKQGKETLICTLEELLLKKDAVLNFQPLYALLKLPSSVEPRMDVSCKL